MAEAKWRQLLANPAVVRLATGAAAVLVAALLLTQMDGAPKEDGFEEPRPGGVDGGFLAQIRDRMEQTPVREGRAVAVRAALADAHQTVTTRLGHVTTIFVPPPETLADVVVGDIARWDVSSTERLVFIRPLTAGARSNLLLLTGSGDVVPFLVVEDAALAIDTVVRVQTGAALVRGVRTVHPVARVAAAAEEAGP